MAAILIVDDDDLFRSLVGMFLEGAGYDCSQAVSVGQARAWLMTKKFEVVLSDFNMPRETGLDLLGYMLAECPETPFIMMTGDNNPEIRRRAIEMGAQECIGKPFRLSNLLRSVDRALSQNLQPDPGTMVELAPYALVAGAALKNTEGIAMSDAR